jgi:hypothetical protein
MNRHRLLRALQSAVGLPCAGVLAVSVAVLVNTTTYIPVIAQQRVVEESIAHPQQRPRELPTSVLRNENTWIDLGPEINICREC